MAQGQVQGEGGEGGLVAPQSSIDKATKWKDAYNSNTPGALANL